MQPGLVQKSVVVAVKHSTGIRHLGTRQSNSHNDPKTSAAASFELSTQPYIPYKLSRTKKIRRKIVALEGINYFTPATIYSVPMMLLQQFLHAPSRRLDICFVFFPTPFEYTQLTLHMKPAWRSLPKLYTPWCITLRTRPFSSLLMSYY